MDRIFIGYDPNETVAFHTLAQSIYEHATRPLSITPIKLGHLPMFDRARDPLQSTEFSFTRFLVPYLCDYQGTALFMDSDMMVMSDISELFDLFDSIYAVQVVKHDYSPRDGDKFLGQTQTKYRRKNWSSVMLFNNKLCRGLTPAYVNKATGLDLHQFKWIHDEFIGPLPPEWNYLVGENQPLEVAPKLIHWTLGGPWFPDSHNCRYSSEWKDLYVRSTSATGF